MMQKRLLWWVGGGLGVGLIVGTFGRNMPVRWVFPLAIAIGALMLFMYADSMSRNINGKKEKDMDKDGLIEPEEKDVVPLSKDAAREWLDEFLVRQQDQRDQQGQ